MSSPFNIHPIPAEKTYPVRHAELRKGRPVESCKLPEDDNPGAVHLGGYWDQNLVAVATFIPQIFVELPQSADYRLRGMAVLETHHRKGLGQKLLTFGEALLQEHKSTGVWMDARIAAVPFYQSLGYTIHGAIFEVPQVGPHYKMYKTFNY